MNRFPWHEETWRALSARVAAQTVPHAILLSGPPGTGKQQLAMSFAAMLLCENRLAEGDQCGACKSCTLFVGGTHPDFHLCTPLEDSRQVLVDQIRELAGKSVLTSSVGRYQVFIVSPADAMNRNAANAFLKTLEEPSPNSVILLLADRPGSLPATIRSRCQPFQVHPPSNETALQWLATQGDWEPEQSRTALSACGGAPLLAAAVLAEGSVEKLNQAVELLVAAGEGRADPIVLASQWQDEWLGARLDWWRRWLRQMAWARASETDGQASGLPRRLQRLTAHVDLASLVRYFERLNRARRLIETSVKQELVVEELLISWRDLVRKGG
jgi:DNA polymerase-3 subunit delta'